jgi:glycolate oxidase iron-sulfur subunit
MREREALDDCVHCGFCLPTCPTYVSWSEEEDSPRGRIDLMRALRERALPLDASVVTHFDRCLGCMACVTACPSGVRYDHLIEEMRARVETTHRRSLLDRLHRGLIFALFPHPRRLRALVWLLLVYVKSGLQWLARKSGLLGLLPRRLRQLEALLPPVSLRQLRVTMPRETAPATVERARVALVSGCVQRVFFPQVNEATLRVLAAEGCRVVVPADQGCCGALSLHAGRAAESRQLTRALIERFAGEDVATVVVNAAGCGSHLKECARLFADDAALAARAAQFAAKVRDVSELLVALGPAAPRHPLPLKVAYHDACHLAHAQGVRHEPRALLGAIPGLELCEISDGEQCCGSAGIYNLVEPASADAIGERKVGNVIATHADLVASANPGCSLHMGRLLRQAGQPMVLLHPIEIVDASLRGVALTPPGAPDSRSRARRPPGRS